MAYSKEIRMRRGEKRSLRKHQRETFGRSERRGMKKAGRRLKKKKSFFSEAFGGKGIE